MTLLVRSGDAFDADDVDTKPFDFIGRDSWGHAVRGRITALDLDTAEIVLRGQGIAPTAVAHGAAETVPYRVELAITQGGQPSVGELVRRVLLHRRLRRD